MVKLKKKNRKTKMKTIRLQNTGVVTLETHVTHLIDRNCELIKENAFLKEESSTLNLKIEKLVGKIVNSEEQVEKSVGEIVNSEEQIEVEVDSTDSINSNNCNIFKDFLSILDLLYLRYLRY